MSRSYGTTSERSSIIVGGEEIKSLLSESRKEEEDESSDIQNSSPVLKRLEQFEVTSNAELEDPSPLVSLKHTLRYLLAGFIVLSVLMVVEITFGLYVSALGLLITWLFLWIFACFGGFFCYLRNPKAMHLCHGAVVGLVFGILAMAAFSVYIDIDQRTLYRNVNVDGTPLEPPAGSIIYFENAVIYPQFIGGSYKETCDSGQCDRRYFCVAPILPLTSKFNTSTINAQFWVGCESEKSGENCFSNYFNNTDCRKNWEETWNSGFVVGGDLGVDYSFSIRDGISKWGFNSTSPDKTVAIAWVPDPISEAHVFWGLGVFSVCASPVVYAVSGILYAVFCRGRIAGSF